MDSAEKAFLKQQAYILRELTHTEGWGWYEKALHEVLLTFTNAILNGADNYDYKRGYLHGLRRALELPDEKARLAKIEEP